MRMGGRKQGGFTLIELMLVLVIIGIMLMILVPALSTKSLGRLATLRIMASLKGELDAFYVTFGYYPPSSHQGMSGSQCLYYFLTGPRGRGWKPNPADGGVPPTRTWEPSTFNAEWIGQIGSGPQFFLDGYGDGAKALLYYRADRTEVVYDQVYNASHNSGPGDLGWNPDSGEFEKLIRDSYSGNSNRPYKARSYILLSAGSDREFGFDGDRIDDIMNFRPRKRE